MMRALSLTLALLFCLCVSGHVVVATRLDGTGARAKVARHRKAGKKRVAKSFTRAPLPVVSELNMEGLKKLLVRGDDAANARPLLVNFWATWCDPCREEFPDLVRVNDDYSTRGLEFAVVSGDDVSEIKTGVPKFLRRMHARMTPYLLNVPDMGEAINLIDLAWGGELPATYLYDRSGRIVFKHSGRIAPKELRAALDKVLAAN